MRAEMKRIFFLSVFKKSVLDHVIVVIDKGEFANVNQEKLSFYSFLMYKKGVY